MKKTLLLISVLLLSISTLISCHKNADVITVTATETPAENSIENDNNPVKSKEGSLYDIEISYLKLEAEFAESFEPSLYTDRLYKQASAGIPQSQYKLGKYYKYGVYVNQNINTAIYWWKKASELGYGDAAYEIGELLINGIGIKQDSAKAIYYYKIGAKYGSADAVRALDGLGLYNPEELDKMGSHNRYTPKSYDDQSDQSDMYIDDNENQ
jgi:TPR repeat protein